MRSIPGKIMLWLLAVAAAMAGVTASLDKSEITKGETVTLTITADGDEVTFPVIDQIGGYPVLGTARRSFISMENGAVRRSVSKSYTFAPMKDLDIPSYEVTVDGQVERTPPLKVRVKAAPATTQRASAALRIDLQKRELYVGEPVKMTVRLRYRADKPIVASKIAPPQFDGFWIKQLGQSRRERSGEWIEERQDYLLFPQKAGELTVGPMTGKIGRQVASSLPGDPIFNDPFFAPLMNRIEWRGIASNTVPVKVKPLPGGVTLYGRFTLKVAPEKREVSAGKPLRFTVTVKGEGNIEDVGKFTPQIPDATVYADEPAVKDYIQNGRYGGSVTQLITVVASRDFIFPSLSLRYYDPQKGKVVQKRTAPISIHVTGSVPTPQPVTADGVKEENFSAVSEKRPREDHVAVGWPIWLFVWLGGLIPGWWAGRKGWPRLPDSSKKSEVARRVLRAKEDRDLFALLLPYMGRDPEIDKALKDLEANLYGGARNRVDRRRVAEAVAALEWEREERGR